MATMIWRLAIITLALTGACVGWWGWAAFWFALFGGATVTFNGHQ